MLPNCLFVVVGASASMQVQMFCRLGDFGAIATLQDKVVVGKALRYDLWSFGFWGCGEMLGRNVFVEGCG